MRERTFLSLYDQTVCWTPSPLESSGGYQAFVPSHPLAQFVECIHLGCEEFLSGSPATERVLPDGTVLLYFTLNTSGQVTGRHQAQASHRAPKGEGAEIFGVKLAATVIRMTGCVEGVGVRLRPGGAAALLGIPAGELQNQRVSLDTLWGTNAVDALERLAHAPHGADRAVVAERLLLERLTGNGNGAGGEGKLARPASHAGVVEAMRRIRASDGRIKVRDLAVGLGIGSRRLEQLFHHYVGLSPKAACRLERFHASTRLLRHDAALDLSTIAYRCGFADHAHFVHEVRSFSGLTPSALRAHLRLPHFAFPQAVKLSDA